MRKTLILLLAFVLTTAVSCNREMTTNGTAVTQSTTPAEKEADWKSGQQGAADYDAEKQRLMDEEQDMKNYKMYYEKGLASHNAGDFKTAVKLFTQSIEAYGEFAEAWGMRGMSRFKADDATGACSDWKHAIQMGYAPAASYYDQNCN